MLSTLAQSLIAPKSIEQTNEIIDLLIKHETLLEKSDQLWQELSQIEQDLEKQISLYGLRKNNNFSNMNHYCFFPSHSIQQIKVKLLSFKDGIKQDWEPLLDKSHLFASEEEVSKHLTSITDPNCQAIIFAYIQRNFPVGTGENFEFSCYTKVLKAMDGLLVKITQLEKAIKHF
ncbi:MAG: hypothetical protein HWD59_14460 [Coxiellaceae bacterium]|nr:MAG: hypothetical protein HWD59_14460 [Coxiellaceae bacterium]